MYKLPIKGAWLEPRDHRFKFWYALGWWADRLRKYGWQF